MASYRKGAFTFASTQGLAQNMGLRPNVERPLVIPELEEDNFSDSNAAGSGSDEAETDNAPEYSGDMLLRVLNFRAMLKPSASVRDALIAACGLILVGEEHKRVRAGLADKTTRVPSARTVVCTRLFFGPYSKANVVRLTFYLSGDSITLHWLCLCFLLESLALTHMCTIMLRTFDRATQNT